MEFLIHSWDHSWDPSWTHFSDYFSRLFLFFCFFVLPLVSSWLFFSHSPSFLTFSHLFIFFCFFFLPLVSSSLFLALTFISDFLSLINFLLLIRFLLVSSWLFFSHSPSFPTVSLTDLFFLAYSFFPLFPLDYFSHSPSFLTFSHLLIFSYLFFKAAISSSSLISCPSMPISLCLHYSLSYATCQFVFRAESLPVEAKCRIPTVVQLASA